MTEIDLIQIEKKLFDAIEKELKTRNYDIEVFVQKYREDIGEILYKRVQDEKFNQSLLVLPIILGKILPYIDDKHYIPILLSLLKDEQLDNRMRFQVIQKLGWRSTEAQKAIPYLLKCLNIKGPVGDISAIVLSELGYEKFDELIPNLISALKNNDYCIYRMNAARQLFKNRLFLQQVLPDLIIALNSDPDFRSRQKIARYFGEIDNEKVKEALLDAHKNDEHPIVRTVAKTSLADLSKLNKI
ncbi:MAG: HEAT repeat domain-containing protein [Candidatus Heimdallarchaeota archaeon]|nr:HEAT repeat domain-containing protein [Candidatus Heimdallarchaeota archaeon]